MTEDDEEKGGADVVHVTHAVAGVGRGLYPAVRTIVVDALAGGIGAVLPTNAAYKEKRGFASGTMQRAIDLLREREALGIVSRGMRGREIVTMDIGQCWQAAGLAPVRIVAPPAGVTETDVLTEHLARDLTDLGLPYTVLTRHGGQDRLSQTNLGVYDIAIVSRATYDDVARLDGPSEERLVRTLERGTYYGPERLVVVRRAGDTDGLPVRIGVDRRTLDHVSISMRTYPPEGDHTYIDIAFPRTLAWVRRGRVDAAIWHRTRSAVPPTFAGIDLIPLEDTPLGALDGHRNAAVLMCSAHRPELASVLSALPLVGIAEAQQRAFENERRLEEEFA